MKFPLIGSDRIRESVLAWVAMRRIPHAILIEGEKGTGRHTLAKFIANSRRAEAVGAVIWQKRAHTPI